MARRKSGFKEDLAAEGLSRTRGYPGRSLARARLVIVSHAPSVTKRLERLRHDVPLNIRGLGSKLAHSIAVPHSCNCSLGLLLPHSITYTASLTSLPFTYHLITALTVDPTVTPAAGHALVHDASLLTEAKPQQTPRRPSAARPPLVRLFQSPVPGTCHFSHRHEAPLLPHPKLSH